MVIGTFIPQSATAGSGSAPSTAQPALYAELMKKPHLPLNQLSEYVRPIPVNSPKLLTRKPLHGNADLYSQHDNRHALKHLIQYFITDQEYLSSPLTVEQATAYLQQQAGNGYPEAQDLLAQLGAPEDILTAKTTSLRTSTYDTLLSLPVVGSATKAFARRSERLQVKKLLSSAGNIKLPAVVTPQIGIPAPDETVTKEDLRQDLKDKRELKEVLRTAGGTSLLTKIAIGALGVHALAQTAKAISTPPPSLTMSPIQPQSDNSYTGVVNIPNCPDGTCPGFLTLSRPVSALGSSAPLCQIDTSQCVDNVCETSPECGLAAITTAKSDGSSQVEYIVSPKTPGSFQMKYTSENGLVTANSDLARFPYTDATGSEPGNVKSREKRQTLPLAVCVDMLAEGDREWHAGTNTGFTPVWTDQSPSWGFYKSSRVNLYGNKAVKVKSQDCSPLSLRLRHEPTSGNHTDLYVAAPKINVNCLGGGQGVRRISQPDSNGNYNFPNWNIADNGTATCVPPDSIAYNCPTADAFTPSPNTPATPLTTNDIPIGYFNTALSSANPRVLVTNGQGQFARWGDLINSLKTNHPGARCEGPLKGQPNANFIQASDIDAAFNQTVAAYPALECQITNSFTPALTTPDTPLDYRTIPLGRFNQALSDTANPKAVITNGQDQFVRWDDFLSTIKTNNPDARCEGSLSNLPNSEYLTPEDLNAAFNQTVANQPGLACTASNSFTPPLNTPTTPFNISDIPLGGLNQALGDVNGDVYITNGQGRTVRWADLQATIKYLFPYARCQGSLAGQPNAEFLRTADLNAAFDSTIAALECNTAKAANLTDEPRSPLNIYDIPLGTVNAALTAVSDDVLITDGSDRFVRWADFSATLKTQFPNARCEGELSGEANSEFLNAGNLETAFNETVSNFPVPPQACYTPVQPSQLGSVSRTEDINDIFQKDVPLQLEANVRIYNGSNYAYWEDIVDHFPESLDFYHNHGCADGDLIWRQINDTTVAQAFAAADKAGAIAPDNCEAFIATINEPSIPLDLNNATTLFDKMAAAYSDVGLLVQPDQPMTFEGNSFTWGDIVNFLPTDKQCDITGSGSGTAAVIATAATTINGSGSGSGSGSDPSTIPTSKPTIPVPYKGVNEVDLLVAYGKYKLTLPTSGATSPNTASPNTASPNTASPNTASPNTTSLADDSIIPIAAGGAAGGAVALGTVCYGAACAVDSALAATKKDYKVGLLNYWGRAFTFVKNLAQYYRGSKDKHPGWTPREISAIASGVRRMRNHSRNPLNRSQSHDIETPDFELKTTHPVATQSFETRSLETRSLDANSLEARSLEANSLEARSLDAKSLEAKSLEAKSLETNNPETPEEQEGNSHTATDL